MSLESTRESARVVCMKAFWINTILFESTIDWNNLSWPTIRIPAQWIRVAWIRSVEILRLQSGPSYLKAHSDGTILQCYKSATIEAGDIMMLSTEPIRVTVYMNLVAIVRTAVNWIWSNRKIRQVGHFVRDSVAWLMAALVKISIWKCPTVLAETAH